MTSRPARNRSASAIVDTRDVFLSSVSASLVSGGSTRRMACGRMIRRIAPAQDMPSERAARIWPGSIDWMPARTISPM
jgi:hypothetical protein